MIKFTRRKQSVPLLNTTSTADISFILLVFFLVISSMDSNKSISRQLAPADKNKTEETTEMDARNVLDIAIGNEGRISVDGKPVKMEQLAARVEKFVANCPNRKTHVVNVTMLADSKYDDYFHVQDAITTAYGNLRNRLAMARWHKPYASCSDDEKRKVEKVVPQRVMESIAPQGAASGSAAATDAAGENQKGGKR